MTFYNIYNNNIVDNENFLPDLEKPKEEFIKSNETYPNSYDYVNDNFLKFESQSLLEDVEEESIKLNATLPLNDEPIDQLQHMTHTTEMNQDLLNNSLDGPHAAYLYDVRANFTTINFENNTFIFSNNKTTRFSNKDFFHVAVYTFLSVLIFYLFIICIMKTMKLFRKNRSRRNGNLNFEMVDLTEYEK